MGLLIGRYSGTSRPLLYLMPQALHSMRRPSGPSHHYSVFVASQCRHFRSPTAPGRGGELHRAVRSNGGWGTHPSLEAPPPETASAPSSPPTGTRPCPPATRAPPPPSPRQFPQPSPLASPGRRRPGGHAAEEEIVRDRVAPETVHQHHRRRRLLLFSRKEKVHWCRRGFLSRTSLCWLILS